MSYDFGQNISVGKADAKSCTVYACTGIARHEIDLGSMRFRLCDWHAEELCEQLKEHGVIAQ